MCLQLYNEPKRKGQLKQSALSILLYLTFASCGQHAERPLTPDQINYAVDYKQGLTVASTDTLLYYFTSAREHYLAAAFNARNSYCKYENDTLKFVFREGRLTQSILEMAVHNDSAIPTFWKNDCTHSKNYQPITCYLQLDKKNYEKGDSLTANIFFKGFGGDTVIVQGKIRLKVKSSTFDNDTLRAEVNLAKFYDLLHQRP